jgi:hypothetical protein
MVKKRLTGFTIPEQIGGVNHPLKVAQAIGDSPWLATGLLSANIRENHDNFSDSPHRIFVKRDCGLASKAPRYE